MPSQATVTAKIGPGHTNTAQSYADVKKFSVDVEDQTLVITAGDNYKIFTYDISAATTFTLVRAAGNFTLTVS